MKIFNPMQLSCNQRTFEQDNKFHWIVSASLFVRLSNGKIELMHDCIADIMEAMGDTPMMDAGMPKPQAEWLINSHFHSPNSTPCVAGQARAQIANIQKSLNIFGDRQWSAAIPSSPLPFTSMPLDYQHAFGNSDYINNPKGLGYQQEFLANIEASNETITDRNKRYNPAGFAPLDPSWPQRAQYQGTYDGKYMEKYFPGYPQDMDWRLFMNAPQDQWFDNFLSGSEHFQFENMHPELSILSGQLPSLYPRCFINDQAESSAQLKFKEVDLHLDTAWFFPDKDIVQLIWRGGMLVNSDEAEQISHLLLGYEHLDDEKRTSQYYQDALELRIKSKDPLLNTLNTQDLIPLGAVSAMQLLQQSAMADIQENQLSNNLQNKTDAIQAEVKDKIDKSISELTSQLDNPAIDSVQKDKILSQLAQLNTPAKPDTSSQDLMAKLETILPGLNSADPKNLDLSEFSFKKIDDIFAEINNFSEQKKSQSLEIIKPDLEKLKNQLRQDDLNKQLNDDQRISLEQQIEIFEAFITEKNPPTTLAPLPRIDIKSLQQQLASTTPELQKAEQELHIIMSNPLLAHSNAIKDAKEKINFLTQGSLLEVEESLLKAKAQFLEAYAMAAHFDAQGLSPHDNDDTQKKKLLNIMNGNKDASNQDWACLDLSSLNLDGMNFSNCLMEQVNLENTSMIGADFSGTVLARANFLNTNASHANFNQANLGASTCQSSNFFAAQFNQTKFSNAKFERCDFSQALILQPETLELIVNHCNFSACKIENWPYLEINMTGNTFDQAQLTSCSFINSSLHDCSFQGAKLPSTVWANTNLRNICFQQADMSSNCFVSSTDSNEEDGGDSKSCYFDKLNFNQTILDKANLQSLDLSHNDFSQAQISSCNFSSANLSHTNFDDCHGHQAQFRKANLTSASMKRANLMEAILTKAIIADTNLEYANLYAVDFLRATVRGTRFHHANLDATILRDWRPS